MAGCGALAATANVPCLVEVGSHRYTYQYHRVCQISNDYIVIVRIIKRASAPIQATVHDYIT